MSYDIDYDQASDVSGSPAGPTPNDQEQERRRSLATTVAGFAALAPGAPTPAKDAKLDASEVPVDPDQPTASARLRSAPGSLSVTSSSTAAGLDSLQINESYDGIKVLWDVTFPGGGGTVIIITPPRKRDPDGDAVPLPSHVSWRGADAIPSGDVLAFASVLMQAAQKAESLPVAILPEQRAR